MATAGKILNWVVDFLNERAIQVMTGAELLKMGRLSEVYQVPACFQS